MKNDLNNIDTLGTLLAQIAELEKQASAIKDGLTLGDRTLVGLGSVVIRDTPANSRVAGSPARQL